MNSELVGQVSSLQQAMDNMVIPEIPVDLISPFLAIPGLVGCWPMSSVQRSTGNVYDVSGQGRTLTYNGNPVFNYYNTAPYITLDGVGDFLSRADETDLDITGTETIFSSSVRGLTIGGWFWYDVIAGVPMAKYGVANNSSYLITTGAGNVVRFVLSTNGTALSLDISHTTTIIAGRWNNIVCRWTPSSEASIFFNGVQFQSTTAIPASIFIGTSAFTIGSVSGGGSYLNGRASLCFLSANSLSNAYISKLFEATRGAFRV